MTRGTVRVHAKWMAKGLMTVEHTAAIEATLRLDETIGLTTEQRSRVCRLPRSMARIRHAIWHWSGVSAACVTN